MHLTKEKEENPMNVAIAGANGLNEVSIESFLSGKRVLFISGMIDQKQASDFVKQIMFFSDNEENDLPVKIFIDSEGGELDAGFVIYDVIQSAPMPVELYCVGKAYSMAAVILACGKNGRYILPHSQVMIHEPLVPFGVGGKSSSIKNLSEALMKVKYDLDAILAKHTGQSVKTLAKATATDKFFSAEEAVDFGLADKVLSFGEMLGR